MSALPLLGLGGLMFRDKPDDAAGGSNSDTPPAWAPSSEAPAISGDSLEQKVEKATGIVGTLFGHLKSAFTAFKDLQANYKTLDGQFNSLTETAQAERDAHTATKGLLQTEKDNHTATSGKLVTAAANVIRLESLCKLKGIDPDAVVPPAPAPEALQTADDWAAKIANAKTSEAQHQVLADFQKAVAEGKVKRTA